MVSEFQEWQDNFEKHSDRIRLTIFLPPNLAEYVVNWAEQLGVPVSLAVAIALKQHKDEWGQTAQQEVHGG